jgi:dTDP-4-amino-4,6-dideoxygalactose transaminase
MNPKFKLFPRFHYSFRFIDLFFSFFPFSQGQRDFRLLFNSGELFFLNSARAGLSLLLKSIAKNKILRVGIQPYTCETVFQAIVKAGCIPVFIDINNNFTIDKHDLESKKDLIDVLIVTHTFGIPADIDEIKAILNGKFIIEDCAHAFLSKYKKRFCGTLGDASVFSISHGKFPSIGHSGFVLIKNKTISDDFIPLFKKLPVSNIMKEIIEVFRNFAYAVAFKPNIYGLITFPVFKRLDRKYDFVDKNTFTEAKGMNVNKNVFYSNFKRYLKINELRIEKSHHLISLLSIKQSAFKIEGNNFYLLPLLLAQRDPMHSLLFKAGYECGKHFSNSTTIAKKYGYIMGSCPYAEYITQKILVMPNITNLNDNAINRIAEEIRTSIYYE